MKRCFGDHPPAVEQARASYPLTDKMRAKPSRAPWPAIPSESNIPGSSNCINSECHNRDLCAEPSSQRLPQPAPPPRRLSTYNLRPAFGQEVLSRCSPPSRTPR